MKDVWKYRLGLLLVTISALAWSTGGYFIRLIPLDAWTQLQWRGLFGAAGIAVFLALRDGKRAWTDLRHLGWAGAGYVLLGSCASVCYITSVEYTSVAHVGIIYATVPLVTALLAWLVIRERASSSALLASIVSFAGVALMVGAGGQEGLLGDGLALLMTLFTAGMIVVAKRHLEIPLLQAIGLSALGSSLISVPMAEQGMPPADVLWLLFLFALITSTIGLATFALGSRLVPATETALIGALDAPLAPLWVWLAFNETPNSATFFGGGVVLVAIIGHILWSTRSERR